MCMRMNGQQSLSRHETPTREKEERAGQSRMGNKADRERAGQRGRGFSRQEFSDPRGSSLVFPGQSVMGYQSWQATEWRGMHKGWSERCRSCAT